MNWRYFLLIPSLLLFISPFGVHAGTEVRTYEVPDVREAFCGAQMPAFYCKCAFHNQGCDGRGLDADGAYEHVLSQFREWNRQNIQAMGEQCLKGNGYWDKSKWSCTYCTDGDVLSGRKCVRPDKVDPAKNECKMALEEFSRDWEKYSDFDERIPVSEASFEVQEYNRVLDEIADLIVEVDALEYDQEIARNYRLELRAYKQALVQNIKTNLLKAFWRLSYVTYITIEGAKGGGGSVEKLLDPTDSAEVIGAGLKLIQSNIPPNAKELQIDTSDAKGKIKSIAWNATLETLESVADPSAVAQQVMKDVKGAIVPGADISDEEVAILRTQHLENKDVDKALAESYAESTARRGQIWTLEAIIGNKYNELQEWKAKEHARVKEGLEKQCSNR